MTKKQKSRKFGRFFRYPQPSKFGLASPPHCNTMDALNFAWYQRCYGILKILTMRSISSHNIYNFIHIKKLPGKTVTRIDFPEKLPYLLLLRYKITNSQQKLQKKFQEGSSVVGKSYKNVRNLYKTTKKICFLYKTDL